ncbi:MAG: glycosyltransferase, partial [Actinobacteria bacterium]|nr:glycosyltransferase [Actinomycetota bacterium]
MRVIVSGGGTAGHINPAIACALELKKRGHEVLYIATPDGPAAKLAPAAGLEFLGLPAAGFDRSRPMTLVTSSLEILRSAFSAWRLLGREHYDVVVCFGGYVSLPVGFAASWRGIPLVLHEQN